MRRWTKRVVIGGCVVSAVGGLAGAAIGSGIASVSSVRVVGNQMVDTAEVRAASRIVVGDNAVLLDLDAATSRVLLLPLVREAVVRREGGLGIIIEIVERTPALAVVRGKRATVLDQDGVEIPGVAAAGLPALRVEREAAVDAPVVRAALRVGERLKPRERRKAQIALTPDRGLVLHLGRRVIVLGTPTGIDRKLKLWRAVSKGEGRGAIRIDVSEAPRIAVSKVRTS